MEDDYLDEALAGFSGYVAADELYDGPFCVLSIVDNRTHRRLMYAVLEHSPTHDDIRTFFRRFHAALDRRGLGLCGITTDASPLYPTPIAAIFPGVKHQVCRFHILQELTKAVLRAVAQARKKLAATKPKLGRGRPSTAKAKRQARCKARIQARIKDLFDHRHLFVQRELTPAERRRLQRISRRENHLKTLREVMDDVYRLFDRRCRTDTALAKLAILRRRLSRFKTVAGILSKLNSPNVDKALTFLDDKLLPSTSNAVERGNRRHRKMQKTIYKVRTKEHIEHRVALDMLRESQCPDRTTTIESLHYARAG